MDARPSRTGLLISALGGLALSIGVFMPWYGVSLTQAAVDLTRQALGSVSSQFGLSSQLNTTFGHYANALVGHQVATLTAHQALSQISVVLLIVGVVATLIALFALAQSRPTLPENAGGLLVIGGAVAALCVLYRILSPPSSPVPLDISVKPAAWICLLGSLAVIAGAMWPRETQGEAPVDAAVWSELSGWTPGA